jgi:cytochrome c biogenesis protein CcmG/thiol:disulfide interchange protein DsbE
VKSILVVLLLTLSACGPSTVDSPHSVGSCLPGVSSAAPSPSANRVPDVELECLEGGGTVRLTDLHRPAIVNLWASWCAPCRTELPAFQAFASHTGGRVAVIGVDTADTRTAGGGLLSDLRVTYPTLFDDQQRLLKGIGRTALPVTLFLDAGGGIRYVYNSTPLDEAAITALAQAHLGVAT